MPFLINRAKAGRQQVSQVHKPTTGNFRDQFDRDWRMSRAYNKRFLERWWHKNELPKPDEMLAWADITGKENESTRQDELEPEIAGTGGNVETNDGNLNVPDDAA